MLCYGAAVVFWKMLATTLKASVLLSPFCFGRRPIYSVCFVIFSPFRFIYPDGSRRFSQFSATHQSDRLASVNVTDDYHVMVQIATAQGICTLRGRCTVLASSGGRYTSPAL